MIWELVKRETAWRELYGYILVVALASVFLPRQAGPIFAFVVAMTWLRSLPAERASVFHAGLPITASDLFLSRVLALFALIWVPAATGAALTLISGHTWADAMKLIGVGAALSVLVLAPLSSRVRELSGAWWTPPLTMCAVLGSGLWFTEYAASAVALASCASVCAVLFVMTWMRLPLSFEVAASKPARNSNRSLTIAALMGVRGKHWLPILRSAFPVTAFIFLPVIVLQNFGGQWLYASSQALPMLTALPRLTWARALPISRTALFSLLVAPWLVALSVTLAVAGLLFPPKAPIQYDYVADKVGSLRPPLEFWRTAPDGTAPVIEAPWHETWRPIVQTVAGVAIYNPYSMGATNSRQFLEWQYRRATLAIYGREIAFNDYHPPTFRPLEEQPRFVALNLAACMGWLLLLVNIVFLAMHWRVAARIPRAPQMAGFLVLLPMLVPLFLDIYFTYPGSSLGTALKNAALLRLLDILPDGIAPLLVVAVVPLSILWWSALRLFDGIETHALDPTLRA